MDILSTKVPETIHDILSRIPSLSPIDAVVACTAAFALVQLLRASRPRNQVRTPDLQGPPNPSFTYGVGMELMESQDPASMYEAWARTHGGAYVLPTALWGRRIILYDPRAIAHFHSKQSWTYVRTPVAKKFTERSFGRGLFWADGEDHKRQRRSLAPAFSIAAIRKLTPIFYDSAHKAQGAWNAIIEANGGDGAIIEVQNWMNHISIDSMGLAGFSHDFGALEGKHNSVVEVFDAFSTSPPQSTWTTGIGLLAQVFPSLVEIPTSRTRLTWKLNTAMEEISNALMARTKRELEMGVVGDKEEKSIIGLLIKGESAEAQFHLSKEEVLAQMKALLLAGYETTSISLTWALIELSRNPDVQTRLRNELLEHDSDATYDQLVNDLPYLDAVVHEILRTHPPVRELMRQANEDDVIPLSQPVRTKSGQLIENLPIAKGTAITIPLASINLAEEIWGEDARAFKPSRWLQGADGRDGIPARAKEVQGHRHLQTFSDGPTVCLGKNFALAEFKAILSVLAKHFVFELPEGADTKIEMGRGFLPRPRVAGEVGCKVPLRVRPYAG